jgi:excisionase family DNA binding protein
MSQHMDALRLANEIRLDRAAVHRQLAAGKTTLRQALCHPAVATASVFDVLCWLRRWGTHRARRVLGELRISETRQVGQLTLRERNALVAAVVNKGDIDPPGGIAALLTAAEVAERLNVTARYVYSLGRKGILPRIILPGDVVRFDEADVDALIEKYRQQKGQPERLARQRRGPQLPPRF